MGLTAQQVITMRAPQWASDPRLSDLITYSQQGLSSTVLKTRWGEAVGLKVLHILALDKASGGNPGVGTDTGDGRGANVSSEKVGSLSKSYHNTIMSLDGRVNDLTTTSYGLELLTLMRSVSPSFVNRAM